MIRVVGVNLGLGSEIGASAGGRRGVDVLKPSEMHKKLSMAQRNRDLTRCGQRNTIAMRIPGEKSQQWREKRTIAVD
jgi:hypothetical protein